MYKNSTVPYSIGNHQNPSESIRINRNPPYSYTAKT